MNVTVPIYQRKAFGQVYWMTLGLGRHNVQRDGRSERKVKRQVLDALRKATDTMKPAELRTLVMSRGIRLEHVSLQLVLRSPKGRRNESGLFPLIIEPRWRLDNKRLLVAYHPARQNEWFPYDETEDLEPQARGYFQKVWGGLDDHALHELKAPGKDVVKAVSFSAKPATLLDALPKKKGLWDDLFTEEEKKEKENRRVLPSLGENLTQRAADDALATGRPREPYRSQLSQLLGGPSPQSVILVGPPGVGKATLISRWVADRLDADDFASHRNLDRVTSVWKVSGKRLIAGMSLVGEWEQRCIEIVEEARREKVVLYVDDLYGFGRIGRSRQSERSFADVFRGPVARGELTIVGTCTPAQMRRLEDEAPAFAEHFTKIRVAPTSDAETLRMLLHESREIELDRNVRFELPIFRLIVDLTSGLVAGSALPGKALDLLREVSRLRQGMPGKHPPPIASGHVISLLSQKTGLPQELLMSGVPLSADRVQLELTNQVMGQEGAVAAATDLILRIRTGLTDPGRPYGVYLFTGPTGTGKTELAKHIASFLYGERQRLLRLDMAEYSGPDGPSRLVGDAWKPEGRLTQQVRQQPFCVVLLDEIEKAHPSVLNLLLQLFDEGRLTDAAGNTADFTHTVVIMTSNLGARRKAPVGFGDPMSGVVQDVNKAVREFFPPELFNRIDRVVPFLPLTLEVAGRIAEKELAKLLARRGLTERNVFVYAHEGAIRRMAEEGFNAPDGARSVRRYLEEKVGSVLTEVLAGTVATSMQVLRLYRAKDSFRVYREEVLEAEPHEGALRLEPLYELPTTQLAEQLPDALAFLQKLDDSQVLKDLSDQVTDLLAAHHLGEAAASDALFNYDSIRLQVDEFRHELESILDTSQDKLHMLMEAEVASHDTITGKDMSERVRRIDPRQLRGSDRFVRRNQILEALGRVHWFERAVARVGEPHQHAVSIDLVTIGKARGPGSKRSFGSFIDWMATAYASSRGHLSRFAAKDTSGAVETGDTLEQLKAAFKAPVVHVVLEIIGLCVYDFFARETGTHIWSSLNYGSELVRVQVEPLTQEDGDLAERIEVHDAAAAQFEAALESSQDDLPTNPNALLPAVRKFRYDPPTQPGASAKIEVEDYEMGYAEASEGRGIISMLEHLWLLRMSRHEEVDHE